MLQFRRSRLYDNYNETVSLLSHLNLSRDARQAELIEERNKRKWRWNLWSNVNDPRNHLQPHNRKELQFESKEHAIFSRLQKQRLSNDHHQHKSKLDTSGYKSEK